MNREHFDAQMRRLVILRGWPDEIEEYFPVLSDIPEEVFTGGVKYALKTRAWFPTPAELRLDCDAARRSTRMDPPQPVVVELEGGRELEIPNPLGGVPLHVRITRDWRHDCELCEDTGWRSYWCGHGKPPSSIAPEVQCGKQQVHAAHEWVARCVCVPWNPTIRRHRHAAAKYSQAPEKVGA